MALETLPPFVLMAARFLLSGSIMMAGTKLLGLKLPRGREFLNSAAFGVMILGVGNGCLTVAEMWIPSGLAAVIITTSPFWMVGIETVLPGGEPLHLPTVLGMGVGFGGTLLLVGPDALHQGLGSNLLRGFLILQGGVLFWVLFSLLQRRYKTETHPIVSGGVQQLGAGVASAVAAVIAQQWPHTVSARSAGAIVYLVIFGSIIGYSSYIYSLAHLPVSIVSIYNYINPLVAVILGWLIYREAFGVREALAMATIFLGVALVKQLSMPRQAPPPIDRP